MANYSIKQNNATTNGSGSATTITVVFTSAQTVGGMNVVSIGWSTSTGSITSVSDNINGAYSVAAPIQFNNASNTAQAVYYRSNIAACSANANTVTVTMGQSTSFPDVRISEFASTNGTSWTVDKTTGATSSTTAATSGNTAATTNANDLIFGANTTSGTTSAAGSGFTLIAITSPNSNADEWKEVVSTGVQAATFTQGAGDNSATVVVAFNATTSVAVPTFGQANSNNLATSGTTISVTPSGSVTINSLIFVGAEYSTGSTETATIANTGTAGTVIWNALSKFTTSGTSNVLDYFGWWGIAPATGTCIPTVTFSISNSARGIVFAEYKPIVGEIFFGLDVAAVQTNKSTASTTLASSAITPKDTDDVIVAFYRGGGTLSALASGWTDRTMNATLHCGLADCIPGTTSAQTFSATQTSSAGMVQEFVFGESVYYRPLPVATSSSSGVTTARPVQEITVANPASTSSVSVTIRNRVTITPGSSSSAAVFAGDITPVTLASTSSGSTKVSLAKNPSPALSSSSIASVQVRVVPPVNAVSVSIGIITAESVFRSFAISASTSSATQSYHTETQIRPNAVILVGSVCTLSLRDVARPVSVSVSSSASIAVVRLLSNPTPTCSSSSITAALTELQFRSLQVISSASSGVTTARMAERPLPSMAAASIGTTVLILSAPLIPSSSSSATYTLHLEFRSFSVSISSSSGSVVVRLLYEQLVVAASLSSGSVTDRQARRPLAIIASTSSCAANDEGNIIRSSANLVSSSSSSEILTLEPTCSLASSSKALATGRTVSRIGTTVISSSSTIMTSFIDVIDVVMESDSSGTVGSRASVNPLPTIGSSSIASATIEETVNPTPAALSTSSGYATAENQFRPIPGIISTSGLAYSYQTGPSQRAAPQCLSSSQVDIFPAIVIPVTIVESSSMPLFPSLRFQWKLESDSSGTIAFSRLNRPFANMSSSSSSQAHQSWIAPALVNSGTSASTVIGLVTPVILESDSYGATAIEHCLEIVATAISASASVAFIGYPISAEMESDSTMSAQVDNLFRSLSISVSAASAFSQVELLSRKMATVISGSSSAAITRLQFEAFTVMVTHSSMTLVSEQATGYRPMAIMESDSSISALAAINARAGIHSSSQASLTPVWEIVSADPESSSSGITKIELLFNPIPSTSSTTATLIPTATFSLINPAPEMASQSVIVSTNRGLICPTPRGISTGSVTVNVELIIDPSQSANDVSSQSTGTALIETILEQSGQSLSESQAYVLLRFSIGISLDMESDSVSGETTDYPLEISLDIESDSECAINIESIETYVVEYQALFESDSSVSAIARMFPPFAGSAINSNGVRPVVVGSPG